jgi:hypothetical protein
MEDIQLNESSTLGADTSMLGNPIPRQGVPSLGYRMSSMAPHVNSIRQLVTGKLCHEPTYHTFDAMIDVCHGVKHLMIEGLGSGRWPAIWVGGSLGRHEMLPHSDIDVFVVTHACLDEPPALGLGGFAKIEVGHIAVPALRRILAATLVDANRIIDGFGICGPSIALIEREIVAASSRDRQLSNLIAEYFYWHCFDFHNKALRIGPNYKYSSGSSRVLVLVNYAYRLATGTLPLGATTPELPRALTYFEGRLLARAPLRAIDLVLFVKDLAAGLFSTSGLDPRGRVASRSSLEYVYRVARDRFKSLGYRDHQELQESLRRSRCEVESFVGQALWGVINSEIGPVLPQLLLFPAGTLGEACLASARGELGLYPRSFATLTAWLFAIRNPLPEEVSKLAVELVKLPLENTWGAMMALITCPTVSDDVLSSLLDWLSSYEPGAYLSKLISRVPNSSASTRGRAIEAYVARENIRLM